MFTSSANHANFMQSAVLTVEKSFGIKLSLEKMTQIIGDKMDSEWKSYAYREATPYMDTSPREQIADIISNHYLGRSWPSYGEDNIDDFCTELKEKMKVDAQ